MFSERHSPTHQSPYLQINSLEVRVTFPCRLFFEYISSGRQKHTPEISITPKQQNYPYSHNILLHNLQKNIISAKLLSGRGMQFTAGTVSIGRGSIPQRIRISRSGDIEIHLNCKTQNTDQIEELNEIQQESGIDLSRLELKDICQKQQTSGLNMLPAVSKYHHITPHRHLLTTDRARRREILTDRHSKSTNKVHMNGYMGNEECIEELEKRIQEHVYLLDKQKDLLERNQQNYRQVAMHEERLKSDLRKAQAELEKKTARIAQLEQEKITYLTKELCYKKDMINFKELLKETLQALKEDLISFLRQKDLTIKMTESISLPEQPASKDSINIKRVISSTSQHKEEGSLDYSKMAEEARASLNRDDSPTIRVVKKSQQAYSQALSQQMKECVSFLTKQCIAITSKVFQEFRKLNERKRQPNRWQLPKQNEYEGLTSYVSRLEQDLSKERQANYEKEQTLLGHLTTIEDLNEQIALLGLQLANKQQQKQEKYQPRSICRSTTSQEEEDQQFSRTLV